MALNHLQRGFMADFEMELGCRLFRNGELEDVDVIVYYDIDGDYSPDTWGPCGGEPASYPCVEIVAIVEKDTKKPVAEEDVFRQYNEPPDHRWNYDRWESDALQYAREQQDCYYDPDPDWGND